MLRACLALTLVLYLAAGTASATVRNVPGEYPTIQAGLSAAQFGDTVLVQPDTYHENLAWPNRDGIRLYSAAGPESTVIHGGGAGRVIAMSSSSILEATEVRGFTITGGFLSPEGNRNHGAGVYIYGGFPVFTGNIIRANVCMSDTIVAWNYGGGVYISNSNRAGRRPEFRFNVIDSNVVDAGWGGWAYGAGVHVAGEGGVLFWQNVVRGNVARGSRPYAGGLYMTHSRTEESLSVSLLYNNLIIGNEGTQGGGVWAGGGGNRLYNNTIAANTGSGVYLTTGGFAEQQITTIQNNIITGNARGIFRYDDSRLVADNSHNDVWGNSGGNYVNCTAGPGDISADPLFTAGPSGGYYLSQVGAGQPQTSPCVDSGTALPELPMRLDTLLAGWTTRTDEEPDAGLPDMGYHYVIAGPVGVEQGKRTVRYPAFSIAPNPVTGGFAGLRFGPRDKWIEGQRDRVANLRLFDAAGRCVLSRPLVIENWPLVIPLDLRQLSGGVYLVRLDADGITQTQKLVIQRQ